jgi:hypothetical protein
MIVRRNVLVTEGCKEYLPFPVPPMRKRAMENSYSDESKEISRGVRNEAPRLF